MLEFFIYNSRVSAKELLQGASMFTVSGRSNVCSEQVGVETRKHGIIECRNVGVREKAQYFERLSQLSFDTSASDPSNNAPNPGTPSQLRRERVVEWNEETGLARVARERSVQTSSRWTPTRSFAQTMFDSQSRNEQSYFGANYVIPLSRILKRNTDVSACRTSVYGPVSTDSHTENEKVVNLNVVVNIIANKSMVSDERFKQLQEGPKAATGGPNLPRSKSASYDDLVLLSKQIEQAVHNAIQSKCSVEPVFVESVQTEQVSTRSHKPEVLNAQSCATDTTDACDRPILPPGVKRAQANASGVILRPGVSRNDANVVRHSMHVNVRSVDTVSVTGVGANGALMKRHSGDFRATTPAIDERKLSQIKTAINAVFEQASRRRPALALPACFGTLDAADLSMSEDEDAQEQGAVINEFARDSEKRRPRSMKKKRRSMQERAVYSTEPPTDGADADADAQADVPVVPEMLTRQPVSEWPKANASNVVARRIALAKCINERTYATVEHYRSLKYASSLHLFEFICIVTMDVHDRAPRILFSHPDNVHVAQVEEFAFPDKTTLQPCTSLQSETYSFVMTREDGARSFGFCRRFLLPEPKEAHFPEVVCVVSSVGANSLYEQLLTEIESRRRVSWQFCCDFLRAAYDCQLPRLGHTVEVIPSNPTDESGSVIFSRPSDDRLEQLDLSFAFRLLGVENTIRIYGALLMERRVILTGTRLSILSSVAQTVLWLLYPFVWQHTFIPILPGCLIDVLDAPTPYLVGLLASGENLAALGTMRLDADVTLVDLDARSVVRCAGDETRVLPKRMHKALCILLEQILARTDLHTVANVAIFEAFMRMYVELFADLPDYFVSASQRQHALAETGTKDEKSTRKRMAKPSANEQQPVALPFANDLVFDKERFVKSIQSASTRCFVTWFSETQQFAMLVNDYIEMNNATSGKHSLAGTQASRFINRIYEVRLNRRCVTTAADFASASGSPIRRPRKQTSANANNSDTDTAFKLSQPATVSPFGTIAAKVKRVFLKQSNTAT